eukprot:5824574-Amphidinium_carterae.1
MAGSASSAHHSRRKHLDLHRGYIATCHAGKGRSEQRHAMAHSLLGLELGPPETPQKINNK